MATRDTAFPAGTPCWVDLFTSDPERSTAFYAELFGWQFTDPQPEFGGYQLGLADGEKVAGLMQNSQSGPDVWSTYIATDDIDSSVAAATGAGATVVAPAMTVGDLGSMAVLVDPAGGLFGLWQAQSHTGFTRYNEAGSVSWDEQHSKDFAASKQFYRTVFGWDYDVTSDTADFRYVTARAGGREVAGLMDAAPFLPPEVPTHWATYFTVTDTDAAVATAVAAGGTVLEPPADTPFGRIAGLLDPTGASFRLHSTRPAAPAHAGAEA